MVKTIFEEMSGTYTVGRLSYHMPVITRRKRKQTCWHMGTVASAVYPSA